MDRRLNTTPLTDAQRDLAGRYLPMARALSKPHRYGDPAHEGDYDSAAMFALVEAARAFDPGRGVRFDRFARFRIAGALRDAWRRAHVLRGWEGDPGGSPETISLPAWAGGDGETMLSEPDPEVGAEFERRELLDRWLGKLPARLAEAVRLVYFDGLSRQEAAGRLGVAKSQVHYRVAEGLDQLRWVASWEPDLAYA